MPLSGLPAPVSSVNPASASLLSKTFNMPLNSPTTISRSPSPSRSMKLGVLRRPASMPLSGLALPVSSVNPASASLLSKTFKVPPFSPTTISRSPSPSRSTKLGALREPTSMPSSGLTAPVSSVNPASRSLLSKTFNVPSISPTTISRSPSPSRSMKLGVLRSPTSKLSNGLAPPVSSLKLSIPGTGPKSPPAASVTFNSKSRLEVGVLLLLA